MYTFSKLTARNKCRTAFVAISVCALSIGTMSPAAAEGDILVSNGNGTMKFIDDGDKFVVCDTRENGKGVEGTLGLGIYGTIFHQEQDGGDAGCDSFTYNVLEGRPYYITICDIGATYGCKSAFFEE